ncbi:hypothetical protein QZH41_015020 [Actinostola sp. cb2023]|nr:hypothetical protein QZH41_015020 [Actinostola sp. cb2023]
MVVKFQELQIEQTKIIEDIDVEINEKENHHNNLIKESEQKLQHATEQTMIEKMEERLQGSQEEILSLQSEKQLLSAEMSEKKEKIGELNEIIQQYEDREKEYIKDKKEIQGILKNKTKGNEDRHFRSNKLNLIWQKLQDKMSSNKLQDLQRALSEQDNKEMNWKELKLHGGDADGMIEAGLRRSLFRILDKYGHKKIVGDLSESDAKSEAGVDDNTVRSDGDFVDKRLRHLWQLAKKHGKFKDEEMDDLRTEFEHHRLKIDEYNVLLNTLQKQHEISDNSLDVHDKLKDHEMDKLKKVN